MSKFHLRARRSPQLRAAICAWKRLLISSATASELGVCVQIQVAAKIGPVIERLDHRDIETFLLEGIADRMQKGHRIVDARMLRRQRRYGPLGTNLVLGIARDLKKNLQPANHYVVEVGQGHQIIKFLPADGCNLRSQRFVGGRRMARRKQQARQQVQRFL